jgi:hypothetical protein
MTERTRDEIDVRGIGEVCYAVAADVAAYPEWETRPGIGTGPATR